MSALDLGDLGFEAGDLDFGLGGSADGEPSPQTPKCSSKGAVVGHGASQSPRRESDARGSSTKSAASAGEAQISMVLGSSGLGGEMVPPAGRTCAACLESAFTKSPLCTGQYRTWDYPDWTSNWCKHCASVARLTLTPTHGSLSSALVWLNEAPAHRDHFMKRVVAYLSLKLEAAVQRVSLVSLEARVEVLDMMSKWFLHGLGLPKVWGIGPRVMLDMASAESILVNPLMSGAIVHEARINGLSSLMVSVPADDVHQLRASAPRLLVQYRGAPLPTSEEWTQTVALSEVLASPDTRCEEQAASDIFGRMSTEWSEVRSAHAAAGFVVGRRPRSAESPRPSASGTQLAMRRPMLEHALGSPGSEPQEDLEDGASAHSGRSSAAPPSSKKRKVVQQESFDREVNAKVAALRTEQWSQKMCDKSVDGLITRMTNSRSRLLSECNVELAAHYSQGIDALVALQEFGNIHKRGYDKTKRDSALKDLVRPLRALREVVGARPERWHASLKELSLKVDFYDRWSEGLYESAFELLHIPSIEASFGCDQDMEPVMQQVAAISFAIARIEVSIISKVSLVKSDCKNFCPGVNALGDFLCRIQGKVPHIPKGIVCRSYTPEMRNRAERLQEQVAALPVITTSILADLGLSGYSMPWPSVVKRAPKGLARDPDHSIGALV